MNLGDNIRLMDEMPKWMDDAAADMLADGTAGWQVFFVYDLENGTDGPDLGSTFVTGHPAAAEATERARISAGYIKGEVAYVVYPVPTDSMPPSIHNVYVPDFETLQGVVGDWDRRNGRDTAWL